MWLWAAMAAAAVGVAVTGTALAQSVNPGRDCQTITTCRFSAGGSYRGCLSSYSCRYCRFVPTNCRIGGRPGKCSRAVCTWG
jgi:hypothetical protein